MMSDFICNGFWYIVYVLSSALFTIFCIGVLLSISAFAVGVSIEAFKWLLQKLKGED